MKRFLSILLALVLMLCLVPSAFAATGAAPYSLPYLKDIDGAEYKQCISLDDVITESSVRIQRTLEVYDVFEYQLINNLSWAEIIAQFRQAFESAEYRELIVEDSNGDEQYWYKSGNDVFIILGETASHDILNEGGLVYIEHDYVTVPASQITAQQAAEALYGLGLFNGTGTDSSGNPIFELDRAPTRHEAVTMLVRLLGKEEEAKSGTWNMPFTDVADWAKPYVGYAYANGLTAGTSQTTYSGNNPVTASQYITFVLRALGYSSGTDFQWDKAWELSDKIGLTDGSYNAETTSFTRGDVAIISYSSLFVDEKPVDYSYLALSDFRSVRRDYSSAVAECGYAYEFTDLNGDQCVLTIVRYKIQTQWELVTLHNLTKGTSVTDPEQYYNELINRSYGQNKITYMKLKQEILEQELTAKNAMVSVLKGGTNTASGSFLSAEYLNQ